MAGAITKRSAKGFRNGIVALPLQSYRTHLFTFPQTKLTLGHNTYLIGLPSHLHCTQSSRSTREIMQGASKSPLADGSQDEVLAYQADSSQHVTVPTTAQLSGPVAPQ